jgi:hypothetical protein
LSRPSGKSTVPLLSSHRFFVAEVSTAAIGGYRFHLAKEPVHRRMVEILRRHQVVNDRSVASFVNHGSTPLVWFDTTTRCLGNNHPADDPVPGDTRERLTTINTSESRCALRDPTQAASNTAQQQRGDHTAGEYLRNTVKAWLLQPLWPAFNRARRHSRSMTSPAEIFQLAAPGLEPDPLLDKIQVLRVCQFHLSARIASAL